VLISGRVGLPGLGVASAAFATILSFLLTLVLLVVYIRRRKHTLALDGGVLTLFRIDWTVLKLVLRIGVPTGIQLVIVSLSEIAVIFLVNRFGSDATAAYGAVNQIASYAQLPTASIAIAASIFAAQAIGSGHIARIFAIVRTGIFLNLVLTGALVALAYILSRTLISCFIIRPEVVDLAQGLLHITLWSYVILGIAAVLAGVMRASGTVLVPVTISILAIVCIEVPAAWWLSGRIGINGIWYAYPIAFVAMLVLQAIYFRFFWTHKAVAPLDRHDATPKENRRDHGAS
jgi:putative MATE family efflux protein